ncbi:hypothetical protein [Actinomadura livida]|uniref:Uncharacterized protein n=1 Tax=Actinomadura livida TaxID=79909 RepID=A0A7W7I9C7_9ACTN|nr:MULTISPECIES: hypothetical protein [Actinomadura]MBB4772810.1 hypothetical protein [Actinomadura catellatispora]GGU12882.1 hypothetical protein GCM10010208_42250 [Actinomadura livida]
MSDGFPDLPQAPPIDGGLRPPKAGYERFTRQAVLYLPVVRRGELLGHLWAAESNAKAAGFVRRTAAQAAGAEAAAVWGRRLDESHDRGLPALEAVRGWVGAAEDPVGGAIPADAREFRAVSLGALHELTNPGAPVSPGPLVQDGLYPDGTPEDRSQGWGPLVSVRPPSYAARTAAPVLFYPVTRGGTVLGYVWAALSEQAAAYLRRAAAGRDGEIAGGLWEARLAHAFGAGVPAADAVRRLRGTPEDPLAGGVAADAQEGRAAGLDELDRLARA